MSSSHTLEHSNPKRLFKRHTKSPQCPFLNAHINTQTHGACKASILGVFLTFTICCFKGHGLGLPHTLVGKHRFRYLHLHMDAMHSEPFVHLGSQIQSGCSSTPDSYVITRTIPSTLNTSLDSGVSLTIKAHSCV